MVKFLPSYVGSKAYWVPYLEDIRGDNIVELFCGSAVISANLANKAVLNDLDPYLYKIYKNYEQLKEIDPFTSEDYFLYRKKDNWWEYIYFLLSMSFSGVYRYSNKSGFNVPIKKNLTQVSKIDELKIAKKRFKKLAPTILNKNYLEIDLVLLFDSTVILDPPYENSQASYNTKQIDYHIYWQYVSYLEGWAKRIILFDRLENMPFKESTQIRKMRVNGKKQGGVEAMFIFEDSLKTGQKGEEIFLSLYKDTIKKNTDFKGDFIIKETGEKLELKTDYYDMNRTNNFFLEKFSSKEDKSLGGPWQALANNCPYFVYFFVKNNKAFMFNTKELVDYLDTIIADYKPIDIPNKGYTTVGFKIPRKELQSIFEEVTYANL